VKELLPKKHTQIQNRNVEENYEFRSTSTSFCKKKKQKKFAPGGFGTSRAKPSHEQKFFASFFQKRSAFFLP
jgi:hypothetical protein